MLKKIYMVYDKIRAVIIITLLSVVIALAMAQVVLRYFTGPELRPFAWGDEIMRMLVIWVAFLAASLGVKESAHLSVSYILDKALSKKVAMVLRKASIVVLLAVLWLLTYYGFDQVIFTKNSTLQNLPISMAWFYSAVPVGCLLLSFEYLLILIFGEHPFSSEKLAAEEQTLSGGEAVGQEGHGAC